MASAGHAGAGRAGRRVSHRRRRQSRPAQGAGTGAGGDRPPRRIRAVAAVQARLHQHHAGELVRDRGRGCPVGVTGVPGSAGARAGGSPVGRRLPGVPRGSAGPAGSVAASHRCAGGAARAPERAGLHRAPLRRARHRAHRRPARRPRLEGRCRPERAGYALRAQHPDRGGVHDAAQPARGRNGIRDQATELRRPADRELQPDLRAGQGGRRPGGIGSRGAGEADRDRRRRRPPG